MKHKKPESQYYHYLVLNKNREIVYFNKNFYRSFLFIFRKKLSINLPIVDFLPQNTTYNLEDFYGSEQNITKTICIPDKKLYLEVTCTKTDMQDEPCNYIFELRDLARSMHNFVPADALDKYSFLTSHALRAPLSTILSLSNNLSHSNAELYDSAKIVQLLSNIQQQAEKLDNIVFSINTLLAEEGYREHFANQNIAKNAKNIILVDDDILTNQIHHRLLSRYCPKVNLVTFSDPKKALAHAYNSTPDLILLDIHMPELNGWEFLQYMEQQGINSDVIILTSSIDVKDKGYASRFKRVKLFIEKPLDYNKIKFFLNC